MERSSRQNPRGRGQEPKPISGKCKLIIERILSLNENDDPSPLMAEWTELLQPTRIDWITLLDKLNDKNRFLYLKVRNLSYSSPFALCSWIILVLSFIFKQGRRSCIYNLLVPFVLNVIYIEYAIDFEF